jgi:exopolyphosphatase/guanosine-5'-triphosphate,3'-diphosphate pyrophosphatase
LAAPVHLAAIDAGSNGIRMVIARATSPTEIQELVTERASVRLGHNAFTRRILDTDTQRKAARAFAHFRAMTDHYHVAAYRAVATSAAREARNRHDLIERIRRKSGIELEVISGAEEARLVRAAVLWAVGKDVSPRLILDLGGGSLELNFMRGKAVEHTFTVPLGTVRLMETFGSKGVIDEDAADKLSLHILSVLHTVLPSQPDLSSAVSVATGGNPEALARIASGPRFRSIETLNLRLLRDRMWQIFRLDVPGRMRVFRVRKDRAEVMGIAAIVLSTVAKWLNLRNMLVPGVGVREGVLLGLVAEQYAPNFSTEEEKEQARVQVSGAQWFARRLDYDAKHAEQVRRLALSLFDQLNPLHRLGPELRLVLELGAVLHDVGHFISTKAHHRHGEYLVRNGEIPGLTGWRRDMVACLIRYHNQKDEPQPNHKLYESLDGDRRKQVRILISLLRIAEKLESDHAQAVANVNVEVDGRTAIFRLQLRNGSPVDYTGLVRKASLFERELHLKAVFRRVQWKVKVA